MKRVVVLRDALSHVEPALGSLAATGFEAVVVEDPEEARGQLEAGAVAVVARLDDRPETDALAPISCVPPALRRGYAIVLVAGRRLAIDPLRAFLLDVDAVISADEGVRLGEAVAGAVSAKRLLVAPLDPAGAARLAG